MKITKQEKKKLINLIALIKVEYRCEDIRNLAEELGLDQVKIDKQVERIEHAMSMPTKTGNNLSHWQALDFLNELDKIWEDK